MKCKKCGAGQGSSQWNERGDRARFLSFRRVYEAYMGDHSESHIEDAGIFCSDTCLITYLSEQT